MRGCAGASVVETTEEIATTDGRVGLAAWARVAAQLKQRGCQGPGKNLSKMEA